MERALLTSSDFWKPAPQPSHPSAVWPALLRRKPLAASPNFNQWACLLRAKGLNQAFSKSSWCMACASERSYKNNCTCKAIYVLLQPLLNLCNPSTGNATHILACLYISPFLHFCIYAATLCICVHPPTCLHFYISAFLHLCGHRMHMRAHLAVHLSLHVWIYAATACI